MRMFKDDRKAKGTRTCPDTRGFKSAWSAFIRVLKAVPRDLVNPFVSVRWLRQFVSIGPMPYRFAVEQQDYSDFASGRVFCGAPGYPAFPVRLASEIFQRCLAHREADHQPAAACRLYDPCCGGAYHLCTLAYLHWPAIAELIGSDVDAQALSLAERNVSLLTLEGLNRDGRRLRDCLRRTARPRIARPWRPRTRSSEKCANS